MWLNHNNCVSIYESICYSAHLVDVDRLASMMQCLRNPFEILTEFNSSAFFFSTKWFTIWRHEWLLLRYQFHRCFLLPFYCDDKSFFFCCFTRVFRDRNWFLRGRESNWKIRLNVNQLCTSLRAAGGTSIVQWGISKSELQMLFNNTDRFSRH